MSDESTNKPANRALTVRAHTYDLVVEIRKMPHMLSENGLQRNYIDIMDEVIGFYVKAHQKGKQ